jgi:hypothetical protein
MRVKQQARTLRYLLLRHTVCRAFDHNLVPPVWHCTRCMFD